MTLPRPLIAAALEASQSKIERRAYERWQAAKRRHADDASAVSAARVAELRALWADEVRKGMAA